MPGFNNTQCLVLYCTDLEYFPDDITTFKSQCEEKGLISLQDHGLEAGYYLTGEQFLQLVTFMGCSPFLKIYPESEDDENYCSVYIPEVPQAISFTGSKHVKPPLCPSCRKVFDVNKVDFSATTGLICPSCQSGFKGKDLDWRRNAGFTGFVIIISQIFPKEAIPSDTLLDWLGQLTGSDWKYFYTDFSV